MRDRIYRFWASFSKPRGIKPHAWAITQLLRHFLLRPLARLKIFTTKAVGQAVVPDTDGVIIAGNHPSSWDPIVVSMALNRNLVFLAKAELWRKPLIGWLMRAMGQIPVDRGNRDSGAKAQAAALKVLTHRSKRGHRTGGVLALFPEGGCSPEDGSMKPFKYGVWHLARESGKPVIPVGINGTRTIKLRLSNMFRRSQPQATLLFGEKMYASDYRGDDAADRFLADLRSNIEVLRAF